MVNEPDRSNIRGDLSALGDWKLGRLKPMPESTPVGWELVRLTKVARLESGHTPSRRIPAYWMGRIPWVSLHDSEGLDVSEIHDTAQTIGELGLANSSARLLPAGTVVFSRTATVGKATVMGREMATSQDFANYVCGPKVHNHFLVHLFRFLGPEWKRLMAGSTLNTIYMPVFRELQVLLPPVEEQRAIAAALSDVDILIASLDRLIAKKRGLGQAAMSGLLTGQTRVPGFKGRWQPTCLGSLGRTFGGLSGKTGADFGAGAGRYIPFMNVMANVKIDPEWLGQVRVTPSERQNVAKRGDLFFNGSSETPGELGMCSVLDADLEGVFLNSFCFGFRFAEGVSAVGAFFAYYFRSSVGRKLLYSLAQGAIRYNLSKAALLSIKFDAPEASEQAAIADVLLDMDSELSALEARRDKTRLLKQGMMQRLLTGRTRLV